MTISIVIVSYNSRVWLRKCLKSLSTRVEEDEVLVVDNASSDGSVEMIERDFPDVLLIENKENRGFAVANNQGAVRAEGELLLFLNPDCEVSKGFRETLVEISKKHSRIGALGVQLRNSDGTVQFSCGRFPTLLKIIADRLPLLNKSPLAHLIRNERYYQYEQRPDWVSGACLLVPKIVFEKIGGFDEEYFLYVEEVDLCYRLRKAGYPIMYSPTPAVVHHYEGFSEGRRKNKARYMREGLLTFLRKHRSTKEALLFQRLVTMGL